MRLDWLPVLERHSRSLRRAICRRMYSYLPISTNRRRHRIFKTSTKIPKGTVGMSMIFSSYFRLNFENFAGCCGKFRAFGVQVYFRICVHLVAAFLWSGNAEASRARRKRVDTTGRRKSHTSQTYICAPIFDSIKQFSMPLTGRADSLSPPDSLALSPSPTPVSSLPFFSVVFL